jgi:hypothetical protein
VNVLRSRPARPSAYLADVHRNPLWLLASAGKAEDRDLLLIGPIKSPRRPSEGTVVGEGPLAIEVAQQLKIFRRRRGAVPKTADVVAMEIAFRPFAVGRINKRPLGPTASV